MSDTIFTIVGDEIDLYIEAEDTFSNVTVSFAASIENPADKTEELVLFDEALIAKPTPVRTANAPPNIKASLIRWKVNLAKDDRFRGRTATLSFTVESAGGAGKIAHAVSANELQLA